MSVREKEGISMTDKEYIKGLLEEINTCDKIISKYDELANDYKHEIERLNNEYSKAFERLKSQQREIDRLKEENEFLNRSDEDRCKEAESTIRASIANAGTSCRWCEETIRKNAVKEFAENLKRKFHNYYPSIDQYCCSVKAVNANDIDELLKEYDK